MIPVARDGKLAGGAPATARAAMAPGGMMPRAPSGTKLSGSSGALDESKMDEKYQGERMKDLIDSKCDESDSGGWEQSSSRQDDRNSGGEGRGEEGPGGCVSGRRGGTRKPGRRRPNLTVSIAEDKPEVVEPKAKAKATPSRRPRPMLTVQVDDEEEEEEGGEGKEAEALGGGESKPRFGGLSVELDNSYGPGYDMSESGAISMDGFVIRESGMTHNAGRRDLLRLEILGRGASGVVYKAIHVTTLRVVAVKQIPVYEHDKMQQMINELKALYTNLTPIDGAGAQTARGGLQAGPCPHIVAFHDTFSNMEDGNISIVVEFMDGGSLEDIVESGGCQLESVLANISYRVLLGLQFIHSQKQLHRDIKPSNLLINHLGEVKISDFGIVKEMEHTLAQANTFVGTSFCPSQHIFTYPPANLMANTNTSYMDLFSLTFHIYISVCLRFGNDLLNSHNLSLSLGVDLSLPPPFFLCMSDHLQER